MLTEDAVYLDDQRKLSQSHKLAIDFIQQRFSQEQPNNILEIGVGSGSVGKALREIFPQATIDAVDKTDIYLDTSKSYYDNLYYLAIEDFSVDKRYDVIIILDVLEHLENPWQVLESLREKFLSPRGCCVISIPNIAHWSMRLKLVQGNFKYAKSGFLDKTHLRFFTLRSYEELIKSSGLEIVDMDYTYFGGILAYQKFPFSLLPKMLRRQLIEKLTNWKPSFFAVQFVSISQIPS